MKLKSLLEGGSGSGRQHKKVRPNKNLWFQQQQLWLADLRDTKGDQFELHHVENEESGDIYATDKDNNVCFGSWRKQENRGITFDKPRPLHTTVHPRTKLTKIQQNNNNETK
jgi:hypothetical protein